MSQNGHIQKQVFYIDIKSKSRKVENVARFHWQNKTIIENSKGKKTKKGLYFRPFEINIKDSETNKLENHINKYVFIFLIFSPDRYFFRTALQYNFQQSISRYFALRVLPIYLYLGIFSCMI